MVRVHRLQALCEQDPKTTILSIDGIGVLDLEVQCRDFTMCFVSSPIRAPILKEKAVLMELRAVGSPASVGKG